MINKGLFTSNTDMWETPKDFFDKLDKEFCFETDVCANGKNTKCLNFYTKEEDGLSKEWAGACWMNPPYGREIGKWVKKAHDSALAGATVVCLLPARTDTKWFHDHIYGIAEIRFVKGRIKFIGQEAMSGVPQNNPAPFPSMVVIFKNLGEINPAT